MPTTLKPLPLNVVVVQNTIPVRSFLATLLDPLVAGIQGAFALCLVCHLLPRLLLCSEGHRQPGSLAGVLFRSGLDIPSRFFCWKAASSSSRSFFSFLAALSGFTLPPKDLAIRRGAGHGGAVLRGRASRLTFAILATHGDGRRRSRADFGGSPLLCLRKRDRYYGLWMDCREEGGEEGRVASEPLVSAGRLDKATRTHSFSPQRVWRPMLPAINIKGFS